MKVAPATSQPPQFGAGGATGTIAGELTGLMSLSRNLLAATALAPALDREGCLDALRQPMS
jgi:hypothetical protein